MSKTVRATPRKSSPSAATQPAPGTRGSTLQVAMRPRRRLMLVLLLVLALWVTYLLTIYFRTVYPLRHATPAPAAASAAPQHP